MPRTKRDPSDSDVEFLRSVAKAIIDYRNRKQMTNKKIAEVLEIEEASLTRYLKVARGRKVDQWMGSEVLARVLARLDVCVSYNGCQISAVKAGATPPSPRQLSFEFDAGLPDCKTELAVERHSPRSIELRIKIAS